MPKSPYTKIHQTLPKEVADAAKSIPAKDRAARDAYIRILKRNHWSLQAIGTAFDMTRERVRQISNESDEYSIILESALAAPFPPLRPVKVVKVIPEMSAEILARLKELKPLAELVRSHSPNYRKEAEEYTSILHKEHYINDVPLSSIARALGITTPAIRFRFARYGYIEMKTGTNKCYKPILKKNRYTLQS